MTFSYLTKPLRRAAAIAATFTALCLTAACGGQAAPAPAPSASVEQAADTGDALRESFNTANSSAPWADRVTSVKLDGSAIIVISTLTKADKPTSLAVCEAAYKAAKETKTEFLGVAVRSTDDSTLAHRNDQYGPAECEN